MKIKELISLLQKKDQELEVILQIDAEGNGYKSVSGIDICIYDKDDDETYDTDWNYEDAGFLSEKNWIEYLKESKRTCVIYP